MRSLPKATISVKKSALPAFMSFHTLSDIMLALAEDAACEFHRKFLGRALSVLWEQSDKGIWNGLTGNYIRVCAESSRDLTGVITGVLLVRLYGDGVWGEIK